MVEVLSPATAAHDQIYKRALYEHQGVKEYWLVHPTDRVVTIYRLENGVYGKPEIAELEGTTPASVVPVIITWDQVTRRLLFATILRVQAFFSIFSRLFARRRR